MIHQRPITWALTATTYTDLVEATRNHQPELCHMTNEQLLDKAITFVSSQLSKVTTSAITSHKSSVECSFSFLNNWGMVRKGTIQVGRDVAADRNRNVWIRAKHSPSVKVNEVTLRKVVTKAGDVEFNKAAEQRLAAIFEKAEQSLATHASNKSKESSRISDNYGVKHRLRLKGCDVRTSPEIIETPIARMTTKCVERERKRDGGEFAVNVKTDNVDLILAVRALVESFQTTDG